MRTKLETSETSLKNYTKNRMNLLVSSTHLSTNQKKSICSFLLCIYRRMMMTPRRRMKLSRPAFASTLSTSYGTTWLPSNWPQVNNWDVKYYRVMQDALAKFALAKFFYPQMAPSHQHLRLIRALCIQNLWPFLGNVRAERVVDTVRTRRRCSA